jgi:starch synthase
MSENPEEVVMIASENDALRGGKVGGVGDVVRDLPKALAGLGWKVTVIIPSYGFLHKSNPATVATRIRFPFAGSLLEGELWEVTPKERVQGVRHFVFEHPEIRGNPIYCHDPPGDAFARDGTKYALFCSAIGRYLLESEARPVLHLHDWHTGALLLLREVHPEFASLREFRTVFTVHNVAIQGTRPLRGPSASVESWFPELFRKTAWLARWMDPRFSVPSFTPMAAGIRWSDRINTVSPTYAEEILKPSEPAAGFVGGEGLESLLSDARAHDRLFGILNGCDYPKERKNLKLPYPSLCEMLRSECRTWNQGQTGPDWGEMLARLDAISTLTPAVILTSVTRVVEQKIRLLFEKGSRGTRSIDTLLGLLSEYNGVYLLLGTGTSEYEEELMTAQRIHDRLLYLRGYSEIIGEVLYASGSLFVMPSLFEPCGISQMLAMRDGQPCVVHAVGGLKDTVIDRVNGFQFAGSSLAAKADQFASVTEEALRVHATDPGKWSSVISEAAHARFTWEESARTYAKLLYA